MDTREIIDSGELELYVFGLLNEEENQRIARLSEEHPEILAEIVSIEKSILALSSSFSPQIPSNTFEKIRARLELKYNKEIPLNLRARKMEYFAWAASIVLFMGICFQYWNNKSTSKQLQLDKLKLEQDIVTLKKKDQQAKNVLNVLRDQGNTVVALNGQAIDPKASAKVYWNKNKQSFYVDASGLPEPPKGMVYQVWALKLNPLTPTSIGLLDDFDQNDEKVFQLKSMNGTEGFGITLEPAGGSKTPTMEKLYTLGKV